MGEGTHMSEARRYLSSLWWLPDVPPEQIVAEALARVDVDVDNQGRGRGTLSAEPLIVAHGQHSGDFELFAADARVLGVASRARRGTYELRDASQHLVWELRAGSSLRGLGFKWRYELVLPNQQTILIQRSSRSSDAAAATLGTRHVGMIRPHRASSLRQRVGAELGSPAGARTRAVAIEDDSQRERAWIYVARVRRLHALVDLVAEIDDSASDELRQIAVAAILITEREVIGWSAGGG